jgi:hypothetical protein
MDTLRPGTNGTPADAASSALPLEIAPNTTWLLVDPRNNAMAPVTLAVTRVEGSWIRSRFRMVMKDGSILQGQAFCGSSNRRT